MIDLGHGGEVLRLDLRRAAGDDDARGRIGAAHLANGLTRLAYGLRRDGAGVDDDGVAKPRGCRMPAHDLGLVGIETTAERDDFDTAGFARRLARDLIRRGHGVVDRRCDGGGILHVDAA